MEFGNGITAAGRFGLNGRTARSLRLSPDRFIPSVYVADLACKVNKNKAVVIIACLKLYALDFVKVIAK